MKLSVGAQQKFIGCTDAEIYGIEIVSKYSTFHSDPGLNGAESMVTACLFFNKFQATIINEAAMIASDTQPAKN